MRARSILKYTDVVAITVRSRMAYLWEIVASTVFIAVIMFVFVKLWSVTFRAQPAGEQGGAIAGFTLQEMIWYLVGAETIILSMIPIHRTIEREIREGDVAIRLNKPYSYLLFHYGVFLGEGLVKGSAVLIVGGLVSYLMVGGFDFTPISIIPLFATFVLTTALNFAYASLIGLAAFWFEDVTGLFFFMDRGKWLLGGFLIPISLFPEPLRAVAEWLPFRAMISDPARLFVEFSGRSWLEVTGIQLLTLLVLGSLSAVMYHKGIRRLNLNGG